MKVNAHKSNKSVWTPTIPVSTHNPCRTVSKSFYILLAADYPREYSWSILHLVFTNFSSVSLSPTTSLCAATALHIKQYFTKCTGAVETIIITLLYRNLFRAVVVLNPFSSCHLTSYCAFQYSNTSKHIIIVQTHNVYTWQVTGHEFLKVKLCWNTNTSKHGPKRNVIGHECPLWVKVQCWWQKMDSGRWSYYKTHFFSEVS